MIRWALVWERFFELVILWLIWTISWSTVTYWFLSEHFAVDSPPTNPNPKPDFLSYWYLSIMTATNIGANDVVPINNSGRTWLALYALFSIGVLYAIIASY